MRTYRVDEHAPEEPAAAQRGEEPPAAAGEHSRIERLHGAQHVAALRQCLPGHFVRRPKGRAKHRTPRVVPRQERAAERDDERGAWDVRADARRRRDIGRDPRPHVHVVRRVNGAPIGEKSCSAGREHGTRGGKGVGAVRER